MRKSRPFLGLRLATDWFLMTSPLSSPKIHLELLDLSQFKQQTDGIQAKELPQYLVQFRFASLLSSLSNCSQWLGCSVSLLANGSTQIGADPWTSCVVESSVANPGIFITHGHHHYVTWWEYSSLHQIKLPSSWLCWLCFSNCNYHVYNPVHQHHHQAFSSAYTIRLDNSIQ